MTYDEAMARMREGCSAYRDYWVVNYRHAMRVRMVGAKLMSITHSRPSRTEQWAPTDNDKQADDWKVMP